MTCAMTGKHDENAESFCDATGRTDGDLLASLLAVELQRQDQLNQRVFQRTDEEGTPSAEVQLAMPQAVTARAANPSCAMFA